MTTAPMPSFTSFMAYKLQSYLANKATKRAIASSSSSAGLVGTVRLMLHIAGFALLTIAGFQFNIIAGLVVAALSCFVFSALVTAQPATMEGRNAPDLRR